MIVVGTVASSCDNVGGRFLLISTVLHPRGWILPQLGSSPLHCIVN
jgi:hypothetical protein